MTRRFAAAVWTEGLETGSNRDAAAFQREPRTRVAHLAVADGASTTLFSGDWSRRLVEGAITGWAVLSMEDLTARIEEMRETFEPLADRDVSHLAVRDKWLVEGSHATLIAASLSASSGVGTTVQAVAVGDSVLIVLQQHAASSFPLLRSSEFTSTTDLVSSLDGDVIEAQHWTAEVEDGTIVLLASDAVGASLLRLLEDQGPLELRKRLGQLLESARDHGPRGTDLTKVLLEGGERTSFQDDATLLVCVEVPDLPLSDLELLARTLSDKASLVSRVIAWLRRWFSPVGGRGG